MIDFSKLKDNAPESGWVTRFAPSPTGYLHLGHVAHALYVWTVAETIGAKVVFRIEDHDRGRFRPEFETSIVDDLAWLGFVPDIGITVDQNVRDFRQSEHQDWYDQALGGLLSQGLVYRCRCTRKDLVLSEHPVDGELRYPGYCRELDLSDKIQQARFALSQEEVRFLDLNLGDQVQHPWLQSGDFTLRDRTGSYTYQLCVVVDDLRHGVNLIIRGRDILASTGRQLQLWQKLSDKPLPRYLHHDLVLDACGEKLSKRSASTSIASMKSNGMDREQIFASALRGLGVIHDADRFSRQQAQSLLLEEMER